MKLNFIQTIGYFMKKIGGVLLTLILACQFALYSFAGAANADSIAANAPNIVDRIQDKAGQAIDSVKDSLDDNPDETGSERKGVVGNVQNSVDRVKAAADRNEERNRGKARETIERAQDDVQDKVRAAEDNTDYEMRKVGAKAVIQTDGDRNIDGARTERKQEQDRVREQARAVADEKYQLRKNADKASGEPNQLKVKTEGTKDNARDAFKGFFGK
jgi:hypothetical protein